MTAPADAASLRTAHAPPREAISSPMSPRSNDPANYPRRILLAVTGLSPQVVTETLFALAVERQWLPTEIRIITTRQGAAKAQDSLLRGGSGWFHRLRSEYGLPEIAFGAESIRIIAGQEEKPLEDIRDDADNAAVADFITEQLRELTADPDASLHVSIAGGRKTMGFYVGYALSLFGRPQDRLSHVLVPLPYESLAEFFYPAPRARSIRDGGGGQLDASRAVVYLGDIPFVRLRDGLPERLLEGTASFSEAVAEAQKALPPLALHLNPGSRAVNAGGETLILEPALFAFYWMICDRCRTARKGVHWNDPRLGMELLEYYGRLVGVYSAAYFQAEKAYPGFNKVNFDPAKTHVNQKLRQVLGQRRAVPYLIGRLGSIPGTRYHRFGLSLPPEAITIAPASLR
jgi:CRISPR-associated protein (TIGR02584 family)